MADVHLNRPGAQPGAARQLQRSGHYFLWDDGLVDRIDDALFEPEFWARANALVGTADGRGTTHFVRRENNVQWVLRHSRRGGAAARLSTDAYLWLGASRCRVFREWRLLAGLRERGLPVPRPVAARACRSGPTYRGDLITVRVPAAWPLSDWLQRRALAAARWREIGATVARFHRHGVFHHDLNARNVLLADEGAVTLVDFDKGRLRAPGRWCARNLARLRRSLDKIAAAHPQLHFTEADWTALRTGYSDGT